MSFIPKGTGSQEDGTASIAFMNDAITLLRDRWNTSRGGKVPNITLQWQIKTTGHVSSNYDEIIISFDSENPQIYSLITGHEPGESRYDWLHEISISIDIRTGKSQERGLQMLNEVMRIFKTNVVIEINNNEYIQILPEGVTVLNEDYRNLYRSMVSVAALRFNP